MADEELLEDNFEPDEAQAYEGEPLLSWVFDEYERHHRGHLWFAVAGVAGLAMLIYAVVTQNFLFAILIIMFGVLIGLAAVHEPRQMVFVMTDLGVSVGDRFFPYKDFRGFWMVYEPPHVKNVYMQFKAMPRQQLIVPIDDQDPVDIRDTLIRFLDEEKGKDEEPFLDFLARFLKL